MVYIYTRVFNEKEYGIITELYTYASIINVMLTLGMETTLFRFASSKNEKEIKKYYNNIFTTVLAISLIFLITCIYNSNKISEFLKYKGKNEYIIIFSIILFIDAISAIPFAYLRLKNKVKKLKKIKITNIIIYISINILLIFIIPKMYFLGLKYKVNVNIVFVSNLIASVINLILLFQEIKIINLKLEKNILKIILNYSLPLLITQIRGILNDGIARILIKVLIKDTEKSLYYLGIYGANIKLALIIFLFTQAFRYAYEPFVFKKAEEKNSKEVYAEIMKIYLFISLVFYIFVNIYIDYFKYIEGQNFWIGLNIVPIVMISYILSGISFNLSIWYKLTNKTYYGIIITVIGIIIKSIINILFIKKYTYIACAWSNVISYLVMIFISYFLEKKYYKINYDIKNILKAIAIAFIMIIIYNITKNVLNNKIIKEIIKISIIIIYVIFMLKELKKYIKNEN